MPKDVSNRSSRKSRPPHYHPYQSSSKEGGDEALVSKEWEDATCPICMEIPHNAVLLLCSSHDNGCRPYMCDTSYRHSNCLDQYKKLSGRGGGQCSSRGEEVIHEPLSSAAAGGSSSARTRERSAVRMRPLRELLLIGDSNSSSSSRRGGGNGGRDGSGTPGRALRGVPGVGVVEEEPEAEVADFQEQSEAREASEEQPEVRSSCSGMGESLDLMCPLCRGKVVGWKVVEPARRHLNCKSRNCAQESCGFTGSYDELRKHARCVHPFARPSDVDPARQRDWRHLERERDIGDVLSTIQSAMPGARILGDYVIDEDNDDQEDEGDDNDFPGDDGNWWTVFLLFQVFGPVAATGATAGGSSIPSRLRGLSSRVVAAAAASSAAPREALWGEDIQMNRVVGGDEGRTGTVTSSSSGSGGGASSNSTAAAAAGENGGEIVGPSTTRRRRTRHHHQHQQHHHQRQQHQQ
ncbi:uncharacterized protein LOC112350245 [Selaginella moellendorffii]|uniref:uncharacterized protein LOC112350245 n=1 Tax=Selaginella moellendorffii TaxID=88036 RepID=UPI000D1C22F7|nr:uncharacterized protein LOC112350245 [Selaginella moellendorffii]|eukprot:XP_024541856.1 uncharacterized protein LOC112350245 [Selaginella moellendorffii]